MGVTVNDSKPSRAGYTEIKGPHAPKQHGRGSKNSNSTAGGEDFLACHYENTTTEKVIYNGLKLPSVTIFEPLQMSRY
jgi:hypothetical protein